MGTTAVVIPGTPPVTAPVIPPAAGAPTAAEVAALKAELATAKTEAAEQKRTAEYWFGKQKAAPAKEPAVAAAPGDDEDLLDLITSKGVKGLDELLKKRGLVSRDDVSAMVEAKANQIVSEGQLLKDYPDLDNKESAFFKATALIYGELKAQGVPERAAMNLAAEKAELAGLKAGTIKTPAQKTADAKTARDQERATRAAAGAGDHGGRAAAEEDSDDIPTADEDRAIKHLADALEIPYDKAKERYTARAKKGVQIALKIGK